MGAYQGTWRRVSLYAPRVAISPLAKEMSRVSLRHSTQSNNLCSDAQVHVQTFPPKTDYDIIGMSYGNIAMTLGS